MRIVVDRDSLIDFWNRRFVERMGDERDGADNWKRSGYEQVGQKIKKKMENSELVDLVAGSYSADLPAPFNGVDFKINSNKERISYYFRVCFSKPEILKGLSKDWSKYAKLRKNFFWPASSDLIGHMLDSENRVIADITTSEEDNGQSRMLSYGLFGSRVRKYEEFRDLYFDVAELSTLTQHLIDCSLDKYNKTRKRKQKFPHVDIILGLQSFEEQDASRFLP